MASPCLRSQLLGQVPADPRDPERRRKWLQKMDGWKGSSLPITVSYWQSILKILECDYICKSFNSVPSDESAETKLMTCCASICSTTMCYLNVNEAMLINYLANRLTLSEWATIVFLILLLHTFCLKILIDPGGNCAATYFQVTISGSLTEQHD